MLVVASATEAQELERRCVETNGSEFLIVGRIESDAVDDPVTTDGTAGQIPVVGTIDDLGSALSATGAQGVIVVSILPFERLKAIVANCFRVGSAISIMPESLKGLPGTQLEVRRTAVGSFLQLNPVRLGVPQLAVKRTMDLLLTFVGLAMIWPILVLVAIAVKLDSTGPAFPSDASRCWRTTLRDAQVPDDGGRG